jgi:serine protease Do
MTVGIVCQKGRVAGLSMYESYIQTDALINPGNSGGPLLTLNGEVMGVNDFILAGTGLTVVNSGLGFAIPGNMASSIAEQLIKNGEVVRPWLGITMQQLSPKMKEQFKVKSGVLVREVYSGHPAAESGMEPGDIIINIGKNSVSTPQEVQMAVLKYSPGEKIPFTIMRDSVKKELNIISGNQKNFLSADTGRISAKAKNSAKSASSVFTEYGIKLAEKNGSVIVSEIIRGSPAHFGNIQEGMKVSGVNKMKVTTVTEAEKAAASNPDSILLYLEDAYSRYFIVLSR